MLPSISRYLAELGQRDVVVTDWPEGFFEEIVGGWQGEPLRRPSQDEFESRDTLELIQGRINWTV